MSTRNKIAANTLIFRKLDTHCELRGERVSNAGKPRWIQTQSDTRDFLVRSRCIGRLFISPSLALSHFVHESRSFFITAGFETLEIPASLTEEDVNGSILTAFLSEVDVRPLATPSQVRQVVEVGEEGSFGYVGHDVSQVASLFPRIQLFSTELLDPREHGNIFLLICLADRRRADHWIDERLTAALARLATASATAIPYELLCKAALDLDPASLFLALYRSLEALYCREHALELMSSLGISLDWTEMAVQLEMHLGWHPQEEASLRSLLQHAGDDNLNTILSIFGESLQPAVNIQTSVAKRIYTLRNGLVHYRPFHRSVGFEPKDWNRLCEAMSEVVSDVYRATANSGAL